MHILVHFSFAPDQIQTFQTIASRHGDHRVLHTTDEAEAVQIAREHADSLEVLMGPLRARRLRRRAQPALDSVL